MNYLLFSGSLRAESFNKKLLVVAQKILAEDSTQQNKVTTHVADLKKLMIPVYDGDIEATGIPEGVESLGQLVAKADALVICSPEYNSSIASPLKNTIDWLSRLRPMPLKSKPIFLAGATTGGFGTIRALSATRVPLDALGAYVYPQSFALSKAHEAFSKEGILLDSTNHKKLTENLTEFQKWTAKLI